MGIPSLIQFRGIKKKFRRNTVLNNLDLDIPFQGITGIIGISGCGKSTLLNILIGFIRQDSGEIFYNGKKVSWRRMELRKEFGFASQGGSFYYKLTVEENIYYFGRLYGIKKSDIKKRADSLLNLTGLYHVRNRLAEQLSNGMKRRLDIICAMINNPKVLILDEPTEDLDPMLRKEIILLIRKINEAGTTIIITSHLLKDIEALCSNIAIMHGGRIIASESPDELKRRYYKNDIIHVETFPGNYQRIAKRLGDKHIALIECKEHKMIIYTSNVEYVMKKLLIEINNAKEALVDIEVSKPSLEEVFESLTSKKWLV